MIRGGQCLALCLAILLRRVTDSTPNSTLQPCGSTLFIIRSRVEHTAKLQFGRLMDEWLRLSQAGNVQPANTTRTLPIRLTDGFLAASHRATSGI
ncbi:hypothetical protein DFJ73DRAFT_841876, partial [Zopfochytrium polystomum]